MRSGSLFAAFVALALGLAACKKDEPASPEPPAASSPKATAAAPTPPPVTTQFVRLEGEGAAARAAMRFTNASDKPVERVSMSLKFLGADGRDLGTHAWTQSGAEVVPASGQAEIVLGATLVPGTARVEARISEVRFVGGDSWRAASTRVLKPGIGKRPASFKLQDVGRLRPVMRDGASAQNAPRPVAPNVRPAPISSQPPVSR